jgi:hypothetical protein
MRAWLEDHPHALHLSLLIAVIVEAIVVQLWFPSVWDGWLAFRNDDVRLQVMLATVGAAALLSGFSGVVSVYGLTKDTPEFIKFRVRAGLPLKRNWSAVVQAGVLALAISLSAAVVDTVWSPLIALYLQQVAAVLLFENGARTLWLMRKLVDVTTTSDQAWYTEHAD